MNLIPEDYRRYLQQLHILQLWAVAMFIIIVVAASISFAMNYRANIYQIEIVLLEKKKAISSQQRIVLESLEKDHHELAGRYEILQKLRGGALAENMFVAMDRALNGNDIWFKNWSFERAGSKTDKTADKTADSGYFIVIPKNNRSGKKAKQAWEIQTHMEVNGGARDHEALSSFVRRLLQQKQIADVKILNTQQHSYAAKTVVDFKLVITVNSGYKNS